MHVAASEVPGAKCRRPPTKDDMPGSFRRLAMGHKSLVDILPCDQLLEDRVASHSIA